MKARSRRAGRVRVVRRLGPSLSRSTDEGRSSTCSPENGNRKSPCGGSIGSTRKSTADPRLGDAPPRPPRALRLAPGASVWTILEESRGATAKLKGEGFLHIATSAIEGESQIPPCE